MICKNVRRQAKPCLSLCDSTTQELTLTGTARPVHNGFQHYIYDKMYLYLENQWSASSAGTQRTVARQRQRQNATPQRQPQFGDAVAM